MCEKHCFCAYKSILSIVGSLHSNTFISYSVAVLVTSSPRIFYQHQSQFVWVAFHTVSVPSTMLLLLLPQLLLLWLLLLTFPSLCKLCILFGARWESFMLHTSHSLRNTNTVRRMRAKNKMYESQRVLSTLPFFVDFRESGRIVNDFQRNVFQLQTWTLKMPSPWKFANKIENVTEIATLLETLHSIETILTIICFGFFLCVTNFRCSFKPCVQFRR